MSNICAAFRENVPIPPWLSIVGIGEDGVDGLSAHAREIVSNASVVFGGKRHLALAASIVRGKALPWPSPFDLAVEAVLAERGRPVCVLASGDPFVHGVGAVLAKRVPSREMQVAPAASAFSLAAARLGWSLPETVQLSLHARPLQLIRRHLHPQARILTLTSDGKGPGAIARLLTDTGFGESRMVVLEALGGARERIRCVTAGTFNLDDIDALNSVAIEVEAGPKAQIIPLGPGLEDSLFEHDGQITKREIRALTLSALAPRRNQLLWDIGAGAGSVSIEWMLADASLRAIAIEQDSDRASRIERNALALGVPDLQVVRGAAPAALDKLQAPDAIFIGGGATDEGVLERAETALRPGGRLVISAVTLETEALVLTQHARRGGHLIRVAVTRAEAIGKRTAWRPALPITQWTWIKP